MIRLTANPEGFGAVPDKLDAAEFTSEVPVQHSHSSYEDDKIGLYIGLWDTEAMTEAGGPYSCDEFMWLIEGSCGIRNNRTGEVEVVSAGMPFIIPKGYDCQWQQSVYLRKFYVISEHPKEDVPAVPAHEGIIIPTADAAMTEVVDGGPFAIKSGAKPQQNICYEDTTGRFRSGTWASAAFESEQRPFPYHQFAYVEDGSITVTDAEGAVEVFNKGDAFFIPAHTQCSAAVADNVCMFVTVVTSD